MQTTSAKRFLPFTVSAPGKVILFGEHSVVYKKAAVSTTINRRLWVDVNIPSQENEVSVKFSQINVDIAFNIEQFENVLKEKCPVQNINLPLTLDNPSNIDYNKYVESLGNDITNLGVSLQDLEEKTKAALLGFLFVMRGMCSAVNCSLIPFTLEVRSNLDIGAGTGSSAAFSVSVAGAIYHYVRCILMRMNKGSTSQHVPVLTDNVEIKSYPSASGFSLTDVKIINKWAFCVEKLMHGHPSGIDNTTSAFGSIVVTSQEPNRPGELIFRFLEDIPKITILLIATGVSRNTSKLVAKVKQLREHNCAAVDAIFNAMDVIALEAFKTLENLTSTTSNELFHILGGLMELNHGLLRTIGVSHESLEHIVNVSRRYGLASKLTGAGGGGYAITLVPPTFSKDKLEEMKKELEPLFEVTEISIGEVGVRLDNVTGEEEKLFETAN